MINGILLHIFVIAPGVRFMLNSFPSLTKNQRLFASILFLTAVSIMMFLQDESSKVVLSKNYFNILQVSRDASVADIKKSYKILSKELHPDRNPGNPLANEQFVELQTAYNVLLNEESRSVYDKFGLQGLELLVKSQDVRPAGLFAVMTQIIGLFAMTFVITMFSSHTNSWTWALAGLGIIITIEFGAKFGNLKLSSLGLPLGGFTVFQFCEFLRQAYPLYVHGVNSIQLETYIDKEKLIENTLQIVFFRNEALLKEIDNVRTELRTIKHPDSMKASGASSNSVDEQSELSREKRAEILRRRLIATAESNQPQKQGIFATINSSIPGFVKAFIFFSIVRAILNSDSGGTNDL